MGDFKVVGPKIYFRIPFINWAISETTVHLLIATIIIVAVVVFLTRKLSVRKPGTRQILAEAYVNIVYSMVNSTMGKKGEKFAPYFGSTSSTRIGVCKVNECPAALLSLSGAIT